MPAKSQMKFGLVAGINESTHLMGNELYEYRTGFEAGIASELNLNRHFYFAPQFVFITKGANSDAYFNDQVFTYLNLPVLAGYRIQKHFDVLAGPTFGYLLSMSPDGLHMVDFMRKFDFGVCATARYRVNGRSGIDFSYLQSFTGIYKPKNVVDGNTYVIDSKYNTVNMTFQISLFYLFF